MREVKQHSWFAGIDWLQLCQKTYQAPFIPSDFLRMKFFKEFNRLPTESDEAYAFDTRFFSPKQTKKDTEQLQQVFDELAETGKTIPVASCLPI